MQDTITLADHHSTVSESQKEQIVVSREDDNALKQTRLVESCKGLAQHMQIEQYINDRKKSDNNYESIIKKLKAMMCNNQQGMIKEILDMLPEYNLACGTVFVKINPNHIIAQEVRKALNHVDVMEKSISKLDAENNLFLFHLYGLLDFTIQLAQCINKHEIEQKLQSLKGANKECGKYINKQQNERENGGHKDLQPAPGSNVLCAITEPMNYEGRPLSPVY